LRRWERISAGNGVSFFGEAKMPIDDERRRFSKTKARAHTIPQTAGGGELGSEGGVQETLQRLEEMLLSQRRQRAEFLEEEEKRAAANNEVAQRARNERKEKYERLQQAFERMSSWKDNEATREESRRVQGMNLSLSYLFRGIVQCD
jgi:molybdopterin converting factor small subunit